MSFNLRIKFELILRLIQTKQILLCILYHKLSHFRDVHVMQEANCMIFIDQPKHLVTNMVTKNKVIA
jgi:hypothetical protein